VAENIDYGFLSAREGGSRTIGYVPAASASRSGVTIATGFDLGQRGEDDLARLGLPSALIAKLKPYLGKRSQDAVDALKKFWKAAVSQNWKEASSVLRNFGDAYSARRRLEADLLDKIP